MDTERYIGQGFSKLWVDSGDRDVIPSWDMAFERQVKRRQLETQQLEVCWFCVYSALCAKRKKPQTKLKLISEKISDPGIPGK